MEISLKQCRMDSRRDFIKKAAMLAAGGGMVGALPASIQRAFAIDPAPGTTYLDAEHVVILMQENRSFDHAYGMLRGVRGFNDPRAVELPNGNPVWLQSNDKGETFAPFRLDIKETKSTWMGSLPHGWWDQHEARNNGRHDRWLEAKKLGEKEFQHIPFTLGHYNREDLPFYYALADAFTVCDQNFCSSLTPTTPNRLHLWTGTVRPGPGERARVNNEETDYDAEAGWKTFPDRLEEHSISWKIYQNEINLPTGLEGDYDGWLSNFSDNPIEWFTQFRVRFSPAYRAYLPLREKSLIDGLKTLKATPQPISSEVKKKIADNRAELEQVRRDQKTYTQANFEKLSQHEKNLHLKAFANNVGDPAYRELANIPFQDGAVEKQMLAPKGDVFHQFREDVRSGNLPTVSWLVAPEKFSDHPTSPWYGAWYVSETFDILTQNPEVWKKTIFILCYDENDGYFDHIPPFVPPQPGQPQTGKVSAGIDTASEHVTADEEAEMRRKDPSWTERPGPIGLGFRVPLVIASPWSRGGYVCSEVFDHTSILKFMEVFLTHKTGKPIKESNISQWRRLICGDLTSSFRPYHGEKIDLPSPVKRDLFLGQIQQAENKPIPANYKKLSPNEIEQARKSPSASPWLPKQEPGTRPSCALPYELAVDGALRKDRASFVLTLAAGDKLFGSRSAGAPFHAYARTKSGWSRSYAVKPGDKISDDWLLSDFEKGVYQIRVHGPNGFYREFRGDANDPRIEIKLTGAELRLTNQDLQNALVLTITDSLSPANSRALSLDESATLILPLDFSKGFGWHDLCVSVQGAPGSRVASRLARKASAIRPWLALDLITRLRPPFSSTEATHTRCRCVSLNAVSYFKPNPSIRSKPI